MVRWLLVRHGETAWNAEGRVQGQIDTPMSERGIKQAEALGERLAGHKIDAAYASDLSRAWETARLALKGHSLEPQPAPGLRERSWGEWEGMTFAEVRKQFPKQYAAVRESVEVSPPGGESVLDLMARTKDFVQSINGLHAREDTVLAVGHGGCLNALLVNLLELPPSAARRFALPSASLTVIEPLLWGRAMRLFGDISHWEGKV